MKKILVDNNGGIFGVFNNVKQVANGYICDGASYQTIVTGEVTVEEVADDYTIPQPDVIEIITPKKPTLEDLQKKIEELQKRIDSQEVQKDIEVQEIQKDINIE